MEDPVIERSQSSILTRLYDAAFKGDVPSLLALLNEDPFILRRCTIGNIGRFAQSPLHIVASLGHLKFTKEIQSQEPELAKELDHLRRSPLHLASAKGYLEIVKTLLSVDPNMCLARDQDGKNSVHIAAMNGHNHVLEELLRAKPRAAMERTNDGETVLHLCVKYDQPEALRFLVDATDDGELLNSKDADGNTVLHLAVAAKQHEIVTLLLKNRKMEKNAINKNGSAAMDLCIKSKKGKDRKEILKSLEGAKGLKAKYAIISETNTPTRLEEYRNALMVVASLIATMAFQVGVSPPGGAWQDTKTRTGQTAESPDGDHSAGVSIMADKDDYGYNFMITSSSIALVSSLTVILLLISGLPFKRLFVGVLMITMWIAIGAITFTFYFSVIYISDSNYGSPLLMVPVVIVILLLLTHYAGRFTKNLIKKMVRSCCC